jgi:hypothetical protein
LKSPVCSRVQRVRDGVVDGDELEVEGSDLHPLAVVDHPLLGVADPVLFELLADQGQGELRADQGDVGPLTQQVRHRSDVVLVAVGQDQPDHVLQPVGDRVETGQDEVDAGVGVLGEQHPAVDQQQLAVELEHGHVAADVPQPAERDDAEGVVGQWGRITQVTGCHDRQGYTTEPVRPAVRRGADAVR